MPTGDDARDGDVVVVVGKNFEQVVLDETKDVLLEVYAPWCVAIHAMAPLLPMSEASSHLRNALSSVVHPATSYSSPVTFNHRSCCYSTYRCGHCKAMAPTYRKLAKRFRPVDSVVIAKMDGTGNEHENVTVEGYPSIFLFPAGKSSEPVAHEGADRSLKV